MSAAAANAAASGAGASAGAASAAAAPAAAASAGDPLAQLRDIHLPPPIDWWPPAPGWWILGGVLLMIAGLAAYFGVRRYRQRRYRRVALRKLDALYASWERHGDRQTFLQDLNQLLKQTAQHAFGAQRVAALHGDEWLRFLDSTLRQPQFDNVAVRPLADLYRAADDSPLQGAALQRAAAHWLRRHRC